MTSNTVHSQESTNRQAVSLIFLASFATVIVAIILYFQFLEISSWQEEKNFFATIIIFAGVMIIAMAFSSSEKNGLYFAFIASFLSNGGTVLCFYGTIKLSLLYLIPLWLFSMFAFIVYQDFDWTEGVNKKLYVLLHLLFLAVLIWFSSHAGLIQF